MKEKLQAIVNKELEQLPSLLEQLQPRDRINFLIKLMPFVMAKERYIEDEGLFWSAR